MNDDQVVLLDDTGRSIGAMDKRAVHHAATPLHLAFSCYIFDEDGRLLLTRRAITKPTWPGVWTNSCCGHPRPDEDLAEAVRRRVREELGLTLVDLRCVLPDFSYRAVDPSGVVENERCPVFTARTRQLRPDPDPAEVAEWRWVPWSFVADLAAGAPWLISPWAAEQIPRLRERE